MATIKSYTDINQSKKLAEILPLKSADMMYQEYETVIGDDYGYDYRIQPFFSSYIDGIPCWSLAALLDVLPRVDIEKEICSDDTYDYRVKAYIGDGYIGDWYNNPVDACVAMVVKLHELKLL